MYRQMIVLYKTPEGAIERLDLTSEEEFDDVFCEFCEDGVDFVFGYPKHLAILERNIRLPEAERDTSEIV